MRIRHYGLLANRTKRAQLAQARAPSTPSPPAATPPESVEAFWLRVTGIDIGLCPDCRRGRLQVTERLPPLSAR